MPGELRDVIASLAKRSHFQRKNVQSIVEILAKSSGSNFRLEAAIGGRNDAHIHAFGFVFADALVLFLLKHAEELALQLERNLPDLVEKQRAAILPPRNDRPGP